MALEEVINNDFFKIEKSKMMSKALQEYRNGFDLADMLIGYNAEGNACHTTFTFDKKASKHRVFSLLKT